MSLTDASLIAQDHEARQAAQAVFSHPVILEAGAGTGKTSALVARIIAWSLGEGWERSQSAFVSVGIEEPDADRVAVRTLSRVVAITFTEAAAGEMRKRVGDALQVIRKGELPDGLRWESLPADKEVLRRRTVALVSAHDHLLVRTIHAFCRRLLSRYPLEAGLHPGFEVDADESRLEEVVRAVVLSRTHEALSEPVDPDFRRLFALGYQPQQLFSTLHRLAADATPQDFLARDPLGKEPVLELAGRLLSACSDLIRTIGQRLDSARRSPASLDVLRACEMMQARLSDMMREDSASMVSLDRIKQWAELFKPASVSRLKNWGRARFNRTEGACLGEVASPLSTASIVLHGLLKHLERINPEHLNLARRVLHPMHVEVYRRARASGIETFSGLLVHARKLLTQRADVRATIQASIDQLLVDEFQDTDALQCDVVRQLALKGEEPPGLFIVGDPKQSIYGWRNADLRAYDDFVSEIIAAGGRRYLLSVNFRSVPPILDEVSEIIVPIMQEREGLQPAFQPLISERGDQGGLAAGRAAVEYWNSWAWDGEQSLEDRTRSEDATELEAAALAAELRLLHDQHEVPWKSFGLLMRSSGDLDRYLSALRDAHIPYVVERDRSYYRRREIIAAAAMTRAIFDPLDHLALIGFLRSAVCGVPDAALLPLWARGFPGMMAALTSDQGPALAQIITMFNETETALEDRADRIPGIGRVKGWAASAGLAVHDLALSRAELLRLPSDIFVERLRGRMMLEVMESARYQGVYRVANLDRFFRRLQEALEDGGDIEAVLRALRRSVAEVAEDEEGRPKEAIEDAVNIMTIHKAKGLDFDHVYLLQMHRTVDESRLPYTAAERRNEQNWEYVLMGCPSLGWDEVIRYQRDVAAAERVRLLYVAMTRARDRLVLSGKWKTDIHPMDPTEAHSLLDLVTSREGGLPNLGMLAHAAVEENTDRVQSGGLSWVFPGRGGAAVLPPPRRLDASKAPSVEMVQQVAAQLKLARATARVTEGRTRAAPVWATPEAASLEELPRRFSGDWTRCRPRQAIGAAVHQALARWPLALPDADALAQARALLVDVIRPLLRADQVIPAVRAADAALSRVVSGGWIERIRTLQPHVHGRHVPVLAPPGEEDHDPVGFYSGFIDLLYTDPETGELVIVDFKTDRLQPEALPGRVAAYQSQGERLIGAVQEAMALDDAPRWELWFLELGTIHRAPPP